MNTLTGIEAERVNQILKNSRDQLNILSYVPSAWDEELVNRLTCQPVINSIGKTWLSEEKLKNLGEDGPSDLGGGKDIQFIKQAHRMNRATCRNLMADRESLQILMDYRPESVGPQSGEEGEEGNRGNLSSEEYHRFMKYLAELREQVNSRMITTVEDEAANRTLLHDLTERERLMEETRDALQNKLNEVRMEKEHVTFSLDQTTRKTQVELQDIKQSNSRELETVQREMSEAITKATTDHEVRMRQLQDQVGGLERTVADTIERNRDEESRLRKEKSRTEKTLNDKIAQYDNDMTSKSDELKELNTLFADESAEYAKLREHFDKVDANKKFEAEEDHILEAVARRRQFGDAIVNRFVIKCQKVFRGHLGRAIVAKLKPKGKGKKGKK
jgi:hypothetical protein